MEQKVNISMDASTIIKACKGKGRNGVLKCSLVNDCSTPDPPSQRLKKKELSPLVPCCFVRDKEKAFCSHLQKTCLKNPIVIIRNLTNVLKINLSLFSTQTLVKTNPNLRIEIHEQNKTVSDENWNKARNKKVWDCMNYYSHSTISQYARYQAQNLENQDNRGSIRDTVSVSSSDRVTKKTQKVKFATNVDLSVKWKPQLEELAKLPPLFAVKNADNMLSYMNYDILGMNTVQLYMKVPGCRTSGHQENNNFCSVNINMGPGDCEWFAVPYEYWGVIYSLCEQNGVDYVGESWWPPDLDVLHKKNVPVYRFYQKPGDIVWVNVGCVHWVQAIGCCNNVAWNVGPFTARQYQLAMERYEWNKLHQYQSMVPMVYLSWSLARCAKVSNPQLFQLIKNCLLQTMKQTCLILEFVRHKGIKVVYDEREIDRTIYCNDCFAEVFNVLICKEKKNEYVAYCIECACKRSPSLKEFSCFKKYHTKYLMRMYDKFTCQ